MQHRYSAPLLRGAVAGTLPTFKGGKYARPVRGKRTKSWRGCLGLFAVFTAIVVSIRCLIGGNSAAPGNRDRPHLFPPSPALNGIMHALGARSPEQPEDSLYHMGFTAKDIEGHDLPLNTLRGRVSVILNVASQCGYTKSNYDELQKLYSEYHKHGLEILAFPSNDWGKQEPWENADINAFVRGRFNVTFRMMSKVEGLNEHPIFAWLRKHSPAAANSVAGAEIDWNFNKFLIDHWGRPVKRYASAIDSELVFDVYKLLVMPYDGGFEDDER